MTKLIALIFSYIVLCQRLLSPGGIRAVAAENMALRQQLITLSSWHWWNYPFKKADAPSSTVVSIDKYRWKKHCKGLFELPIAA